MGSSFDKLKKMFGVTAPIKPEESTSINSGSFNGIKISDYDSMINTSDIDYITTTTVGTSIIGGTGGAGGAYVVNTGMTGTTYTIPSPTYTFPGTTFTFTPPVKSHIVAFNDNNGREIVRLNLDGTVTWNPDIEIDEAAEKFSKTLALGAEISAGLNQRIKLRMRDSVFEDLINIAKEKGSLTAEDLTYLLEASKIIEKLKGAKD